jgi:hypothetical protein
VKNAGREYSRQTFVVWEGINVEIRLCNTTLTAVAWRCVADSQVCMDSFVCRCDCEM